jgi:hypothetical protein
MQIRLFQTAFGNGRSAARQRCQLSVAGHGAGPNPEKTRVFDRFIEKKRIFWQILD